MKKIWDFLNGKKTIIGLGMLNILQLDLSYYETMNQDLYKILIAVATALAAGGVTHKLGKVLKK